MYHTVLPYFATVSTVYYKSTDYDFYGQILQKLL